MTDRERAAASAAAVPSWTEGVGAVTEGSARRMLMPRDSDWLPKDVWLAVNFAAKLIREDGKSPSTAVRIAAGYYKVDRRLVHSALSKRGGRAKKTVPDRKCEWCGKEPVYRITCPGNRHLDKANRVYACEDHLRDLEELCACLAGADSDWREWGTYPEVRKLGKGGRRAANDASGMVAASRYGR